MDVPQYKHRGEDKNGNLDDNFTEEEAIAQARKDGIKFVDEWKVGDEVFSTLNAAQAAQNTNKKANLPIIQTRRQQYGKNR